MLSFVVSGGEGDEHVVSVRLDKLEISRENDEVITYDIGLFWCNLQSQAWMSVQASGLYWAQSLLSLRLKLGLGSKPQALGHKLEFGSKPQPPSLEFKASSLDWAPTLKPKGLT